MVDLLTQYKNIESEVNQAILNVIETTAFINGPAVKELKAGMQKEFNVKHVIPCANGTDAIQIALNNAPNGKIVSWHNGYRLSSGKVRVVKTYYKNDRYCRIFQSYIKLNGAKKHNTKHVCKVENIWKF